ncbi:MAG: hypothetical protein AB1938_33060 [Myxococcota bacterium]
MRLSALLKEDDPMATKRESEAEALAKEIAALSPQKKARRYPDALRARVVEWARGRLAGGASLASVCQEVGISEPTLHRFLGLSRGSERERAGFTRVRVVAPKPVGMTEAVVLRGPLGVTVEGLSVDDVARLLKGLACSG